jgi:peptidoglycan lytic transglycosylase
LKKVLAVALLLLAAACGTTKQPSGAKYYSDDGPPQRVPENLASIPDAVPRDEPFHKFANRPYTVFGQTYVPVLNKEGFKQRGIASWYGKKFHGNKTASGEVYDMFAMTAAHPTLPIPSYARVTNLRSGETVVVRVNDRGPFHSNRIIDLSYAAAARIGIASPGSGMVEVERVFAGRVAPPPVVQVAAAPPVVETPVVVEDPAGIWLPRLSASTSRASSTGTASRSRSTRATGCTACASARAPTATRRRRSPPRCRRP